MDRLKKVGGGYDWPLSQIRDMAVDPCISQEEAAKSLNCSLSALYGFLRSNQIPWNKKPRHHLGRTTDRGYRMVKSTGHPNARFNTSLVLEHRMVMEGQIGRHLRQEEDVHHINGDKLDNRAENLELYPSTAAHLWQEWQDKYAAGLPRGRHHRHKARHDSNLST